jgi:DNA-binding IclR family transcriptional regulator
MSEKGDFIAMSCSPQSGCFRDVRSPFHLSGKTSTPVALFSGRPRRTKSAPVGVLGKVIRILEQLSQTSVGLPLREIAIRTNLNKSTAYRFLIHLEGAGYVFRDCDGYYMVGPTLAKLGTCTTLQTALSRASTGILERLQTATGETVDLAVLDRDEILYVSVFQSQHTFRIVSEPGTRRPLYCTALGKAILAYLPVEQQGKVLPAIRFERLTPQTICSVEELKKDFIKIHRRGYALDDEEALSGARSVAAPILSDDRKVIGGISISGPAVRVVRPKFAELAFLLQQAADEIALRLNGLIA